MSPAARLESHDERATCDVVRARAEQTAASLRRLGLPRSALPRHVAIIMDGNGRWARERHRPRVYGHERGSRNVRAIVTECARLELEALTLYGFSTENWHRPLAEVSFLMGLFRRYLLEQRREMMENNVRYLHVGRREGLPPDVLAELDATVRVTAANTGLKLAVAINYGSRTEITDAVRAIAGRVRAGELDPEAIDESTVAAHLYTAGLPDPDMLIRTAGEMRVSNYLLWQISYAELHVTDACWPDFDVDELHRALRAFAERERRFGGVPG